MAHLTGVSKDSWFPPDWQDDERMAFLFSAFKENREVDSSDWDGKLDFWRPLILEHCRRQGGVCVSLQELNQSFKRKGAVPLGLSTVIQTMIRSGDAQKESDLAASVDSGWFSWAVGLLVARPLRWTVSALLGSSRVPPEESYVLIALVKEKAAELLEVFRASSFSSRSLMSVPELRLLSAHICPDEGSFCSALLQLQREKHVTVSLHEGEKLVKFSQAGQGSVSPISEVDLGIYQLQRSQKLLEERMEALGQEAQMCKLQARSLLREGKKSQALWCLRGSKRVEKRADRLMAQLENVQGILERIANSQNDRLVIQAYQAGVAALRFSLKGVTLERAENLVDQIQELCDAQDEVNQTLASGLLDSAEDSEELEEELKSLMEESVPVYPFSPQKNADTFPSLPTVPDDAVGITDEELEKELSRITISHPALQSESISAQRKPDPAQ